MKKKTIKNVSKTFLSAFVIFHLAIVSTAYPVVSYAFEGVEESANQTVEESSKEEATVVIAEEESKDGPKEEVKEETDSPARNERPG